MAGRPAKFETAEDLQKEIEEYFYGLEDSEDPATITGLAYHLGFESRQSFYDYEKNGEFSYTMKRARLRVEMAYEEKLHGNSNAGAIFALKNFGWSDKHEVEQSGALIIKFADPGDYIYPSQDQGDSGIPESI